MEKGLKEIEKINAMITKKRDKQKVLKGNTLEQKETNGIKST